MLHSYVSCMCLDPLPLPPCPPQHHAAHQLTLWAQTHFAHAPHLAGGRSPGEGATPGPGALDTLCIHNGTSCRFNPMALGKTTFPTPKTSAERCVGRHQHVWCVTLGREAFTTHVRALQSLQGCSMHTGTCRKRAAGFVRPVSPQPDVECLGAAAEPVKLSSAHPSFSRQPGRSPDSPAQPAARPPGY